MAEPYKRKTRFTGLKEHERLQKQRKADAKKAADRAEQLRLSAIEKKWDNLTDEETKKGAEEYTKAWEEEQKAKKAKKRLKRMKPKLEGETKRVGTPKEQHRAKRPSGAWRTPGIGGATGHKYKPGDRLKPGDRMSDIGGGWGASDPPVYQGQSRLGNKIPPKGQGERAKRLLDPKPSPDVVPEVYPRSAVPIPKGERTPGRWYPGRPSGRFDPNAPAWTKAGGGSGIPPRRTKGTIEKVKAFAERRRQGVMRDVERFAPLVAGPIMGPVVKKALRGRAKKKK